MPRSTRSKIATPAAAPASPRSTTPTPGMQRETKRQLNAWDSAFLYMDTPETPMYGGFLHIYAPVTGESAEKRFQRLRWHIAHSLDATPVFRRVIQRSPLDLDHAWFVQGAEVDLDHHLRHHALPEPGSDMQLNDLYARIAVQPMDVNRPLWEIHIIDGLDSIEGAPKGSFAMFLKVHHAAVDGKAAAEMTSILHRTTPERIRIGRLQPHKSRVEKSGPSLGSTLLSGMERYARLNAAVGQQLLRSLPALGSNLAKRLLSDIWSSKKPSRDSMAVPKTIFNVEITSDRCYTHLSIPLDEVRLIRQQLPGCTVNDVFLAVAGGGLRRYLQQHKALPRNSLIAGITVDIRPEEEKGKGGNFVGFLRVPLHTGEASDVRRLKRIFADTSKAKGSLKKFAAGKSRGRSADWQQLIPAPLLWMVGSANRLRMLSSMPPLVNLGATNVPGPRETLYLDGARMVDFNGTPPFFHGVALIVNTTSYDNFLRLSVFSCRNIMPDPERMRQYLLESYAQLKRAYIQPAAPAAASGTKRAAIARTGRAKPTIRSQAAIRKPTSARGTRSKIERA
jgi:diacylglycerol O-acyltransferase / wax synthase